MTILLLSWIHSVLINHQDFNPFSEKVFEGVLRRVLDAWREQPRRALILCYYPSEAYLQCLAAMPELKLLDDIDCNDLFSSRNARERIVVYRF